MKWWRWRNAAENKQFIFTRRSSSWNPARGSVAWNSITALKENYTPTTHPWVNTLLQQHFNNSGRNLGYQTFFFLKCWCSLMYFLNKRLFRKVRAEPIRASGKTDKSKGENHQSTDFQQRSEGRFVISGEVTAKGTELIIYTCISTAHLQPWEIPTGSRKSGQPHFPSDTCASIYLYKAVAK